MTTQVPKTGPSIGPGSYDIPSFTDEARGPKWTMSGTKPKTLLPSPGPGEYNPNMVPVKSSPKVRYLTILQITFLTTLSIRGRPKIRPPEPTPGPGNYELVLPTSKKGFSFSPKYPEQNKAEFPGPGTYEVTPRNISRKSRYALKNCSPF